MVNIGSAVGTAVAADADMKTVTIKGTGGMITAVQAQAVAALWVVSVWRCWLAWAGCAARHSNPSKGEDSKDEGATAPFVLGVIYGWWFTVVRLDCVPQQSMELKVALICTILKM